MNCQDTRQLREKKIYEYLWMELNIYSANVRIDNYRETLLIQLENEGC
jgi:hypothetical protein